MNSRLETHHRFKLRRQGQFIHTEAPSFGLIALIAQRHRAQTIKTTNNIRERLEDKGLEKEEKKAGDGEPGGLPAVQQDRDGCLSKAWAGYQCRALSRFLKKVWFQYALPISWLKDRKHGR